MPSAPPPLIINLIFGQDKVQIIQNRNVVGGLRNGVGVQTNFTGSASGRTLPLRRSIIEPSSLS